MRSFNKLANLHRVFFKRAANPPMVGVGQPTPADQLKTMGSNISSGINKGINKVDDAVGAFISSQLGPNGDGIHDFKRRLEGAGDAYSAGHSFVGGMMNPRNGGNPILAAANRNVLVPGAMAAAWAAPDVKKMMGNVFKSPKANPDNFNDVNNAPPRKY